jgi:hypothetical protein
MKHIRSSGPRTHKVRLTLDNKLHHIAVPRLQIDGHYSGRTRLQAKSIHLTAAKAPGCGVANGDQRLIAGAAGIGGGIAGEGEHSGDHKDDARAEEVHGTR